MTHVYWPSLPPPFYHLKVGIVRRIATLEQKGI